MYEPVNYGVLVKRLRQLPFTEQTASSILLYLTKSYNYKGEKQWTQQDLLSIIFFCNNNEYLSVE